MQLRSLAQSRPVVLVGVVVSVLVPALTLPHLPSVNPWPLAIGVVPWVVGKYVLCPLRWRALTPVPQSRRWHLRAFAEGELLGLLTPGHIGSDVWRVRRLTGTGLGRGDAVLSVTADRLVGALGLAAFVVFAGTALPGQLVAVALGVVAVAALLMLVVRRLRPDLLPHGPLPPPRQLARALVLSAGYQLSIAALLLGTIDATGHDLSPLAVLGAFGASQLAAVVPGPNGASPRDGALVAALVGLGIPWPAALAAVSLKAAVAWLPALAFGGVSLVLARRALRRSTALTGVPA
ncbi:lysylphosphatidylglycerol synthase domain-containing protein [Nocardioides cynanchi]|uniref:lysylphosphatidylglycerol synthase domain-containing protein n=1 Tax=Nocardioides cynanchi TaxID=2558918 RepID=UPI00177E007D|nr:lysylphosphatidylglycerol synthase domain-containing protein [Nocardioides cynanchi]